jgi:hypothetical protein
VHREAAGGDQIAKMTRVLATYESNTNALVAQSPRKRQAAHHVAPAHRYRSVRAKQHIHNGILATVNSSA